jgi:hypothetical protein
VAKTIDESDYPTQSLQLIPVLRNHRADSDLSTAEHRILVGSSVTVRVLAGRLQCPAMHYLTAAGVGVLTGIATAILWIVVRFILPIAMPLFLSRIGATESGSGGAGAVIGSGSILMAALLGFVGGFVWMIWRR